MKSSCVFVLLLSVMAVCQARSYIYVSKAMNWNSAQTFCQNIYLDLATITTDEENQRLMNVSAAFRYSGAWIGLYRTGSDIWQWSDGESPNFFNWGSNQPDNSDNRENCGTVSPGGWNDLDCTNNLPFFCTWSFVLVNDRKTWEEALDYCRTHYIGLASPISGEQIALAENAAAQIQTVSVWTDLHFVNGKWVWVKKPLLLRNVSLMICPAPRYRCGALNTETNLWENRDCNEKLHFFCY